MEPLLQVLVREAITVDGLYTDEHMTNADVTVLTFPPVPSPLATYPKHQPCPTLRYAASNLLKSPP